ncbi:MULTISPECIES: hypothetical protein [Bacillaceae]|uniref:Uncharacterized protein n=1 Tax=Peribacillus huizhouensis TaxID=1501239 RepID=A0ABR6CNC1_9BACI|nr:MULTISPECIES: hypothetical protein [Bacillaceae]MBA9026173.1 hypothetical protein [Peribacillus huizhouensis]
MMWASMLSLGISAAAYGLSRNRTRNMMIPVQNLIDNFRLRNDGQMSKMANVMEFSKELVPDKDPFTNK